MTDGRRASPALAEEAAGADLVGETPASAAERVMDAEAETLTGAAQGARRALRETRRHGRRERDRGARAGRIGPAIPKRRKGRCFPSVLDPRRPAEKAPGP